MLNNIIKRSGEIEEFSPNKLNKWSIWSSEELGSRVDWSSIVLDAVKGFSGTVHSQDLQKALIKECLYRKSWAYNLMAGRLYAATFRKEIYDEIMPTPQALFTKLNKLNLMREFNYSQAEWDTIESFIDHERDFRMTHFQIHHIRKKYAIQDRVGKTEFETPQYTYMRMAIALAESEPEKDKLKDIKNWYDHLSLNRVNAPTPNYINLGTKHNGYASCCLYVVGDDADSLAIGDHIAYKMTCQSAGIGGFLNVRTLGDKVRGGSIVHQGKLPYFNALAGAVKANIQAGRGGACTSYYSAFDPEAETIALLQNPRTPENKRNRDIHFAMMTNRLFAKKVAKNENVFTFTAYSAPDLMKLLFTDKQDEFEKVYAEYENNPDFKKNYINARQFLITGFQQSFEVATHYWANIDEINRHTPFNEPIHSSNLCLEITQPTSEYYDMVDLYSEEDHGRGEVSMCSLAGIVECNIENDEIYESACYYALKMIDKCIHLSDYPLPHIGFTAKKRLNAAVGLLGVATSMARKNFKYSSQEGKEELHRINERHAYFVIKASLKLGQELGNAPWIHKTKWPEGWLPIDTYKKAVDKIVNIPYTYDWEELRGEIILNKGIRNSSVIAHMPTESSSKGAGVPNSELPIRSTSLKKSDSGNVVDWCAVDDDLIGHQYEIAWDIPNNDMIDCYAIMQKFTDQAISADLYKDRTVNIELSTKDIVNEYLRMVQLGMKTRYYQNSLTSSQSRDKNIEASTCGVGGCTL